MPSCIELIPHHSQVEGNSHAGAVAIAGRAVQVRDLLSSFVPVLGAFHPVLFAKQRKQRKHTSRLAFASKAAFGVVRIGRGIVALIVCSWRPSRRPS